MTGILERIVAAQAQAQDRGVLAIWTVYDRPKDFPEGYIARQFHVDHTGALATGNTVSGALNEMRDAFVAAGLHCLVREPGDEPQIVESWL